MTNNDILRRLRYIFDFNDSKMMVLFRGTGPDAEASRADISDWLKPDDDPAYKRCNDKRFAQFLNHFINEKRGKQDGPARPPELRLNNNLVLKKLKIALDLKAESMLEILELSGMQISKHELSALFRKPGHKHYRDCKDQLLRNFLQGLQQQYRPAEPAEIQAESQAESQTEKRVNSPLYGRAKKQDIDTEAVKSKPKEA